MSSSIHALRRTVSMAASSSPSIAVVGGGLSGSAAAHRLAQHGASVTIFEGARGLGGRSATRRTTIKDEALGELNVFFDHGAKGIQVQDPAFRELIHQWERKGWVAQWGPGHIQELDPATGKRSPGGKPGVAWYSPVPHGNALAVNLAASEGITHKFQTRVVAARRQGTGWVLGVRPQAGEPGVLTDVGPFDGLIISDRLAATTYSMRQFKEPPLLQDPTLPPAVLSIGHRIGSIGQLPRFALMVAVQAKPGRSLNLDFSLLSFAQGKGEGPIASLVREASKPGRSPPAPGVELLVAISTEDYAKSRVGTAPTNTGTVKHATLLEEVAHEMWGSITAAVPELADTHTLSLVAHRWGSCFPSGPFLDGGARCLSDKETAFAACGDWATSPASVEGAVLSGFAAADSVAAALKQGGAAAARL